MKQYYNILKDNFSLIVAVPPFFGAVWQLIELSRINVSYIRFFSISQLVPDGVLFLGSLLLFFYTTILLKYFFDYIDKKNKSDEQLEKSSKNDVFEPKEGKPYLSFLFFAISLVIIIFGLDFINNFFLEKLDFAYTIWVVLPLNIFLVSLSAFLFLIGISYVEKIFSKARLDRLKFYFTLILIFFVISFSKNYYLKFNKLMLLPDNLINIEKVENEIKENNPKTKVEIKYLNDKYIFYSIKDSLKNEKVLILSFDKLFKE
ncbi:hypothetical protein [Flavobacterium sp.]|uniref:hypothetical protein n=1 Tax=Flavobacterium sp. TaxID=239 RepID=UPI0035286F7E